METLIKFVLMALLVFGMIFIFSLIAAIPTYLLWNWLMPDIFGLKVITFWQALGLNLLAGILMKGSTSASSKND